MAADARPDLLWAPLAWLPEGWRENVLLRVGADGRWAEVTADVVLAPAGAHALAGPLLPGVVDAHSHAFQRAFAGAAERRDAASDDFWSWRERMYAVALRIGPEQLRAIAAQLYIELLRGGYTHVCEFHYLRRERDGSDYADPLAMSWALADAAAEAGIGLTILPVLYERAGFADAGLRDEQRRFRASAAETVEAAQRIRAAGRPLVDAGLAIHSLRAASAESIAALRAHAESFAGPIHIHVAEQALWRAARIEPVAPWYVAADPKQPFIAQVRARGAYALVERGAWAALGGAPLAVVVEGDPQLAESVHAMRSFRVSHPAGKIFLAWIAGGRGRAAVAAQHGARPR